MYMMHHFQSGRYCNTDKVQLHRGGQLARKRKKYSVDEVYFYSQFWFNVFLQQILV